MKKLFLLICLMLSLSACTSLNPPEFRGAVYGSPALPPNFTFPSTQGGEFTLNEQTDKVVLLFFGYTYCPDVCPATMGALKTALNQLSEEERQDVEVVFVTFDPERDTLEQLGRYLDSFDAGYIGLTPTLEDLEKLKRDYSFIADKDEIQPDGSYTMTHTSLVYVLDRKGNLRLGFFSDTPAEDIVHDLQILLRE